MEGREKLCRFSLNLVFQPKPGLGEDAGLRVRGESGALMPTGPWGCAHGLGSYLWVCVREPGSEHVKVEERVYLYVWAPYVCACAYGEVGM